MDVLLEAEDGHRIRIHFSGVANVVANRPEGMTLYALTELKAQAPLRRFSFVNWDEKDDARLEVTAKDYQLARSLHAFYRFTYFQNSFVTTGGTGFSVYTGRNITRDHVAGFDSVPENSAIACDSAS